MKKTLLLTAIFGLAWGDNTQLFNDAVNLGKNNQFQLNLTTDSTFSSYGSSNDLGNDAITGATSGSANAETIYNSASNDTNYLYNAGKADIANCVGQNDARCSSINKIGDKDTQTVMQSYSQGLSDKYVILTKPDPNNSNCSIITRNVAVNPTAASCITSVKEQNSCSTVITPSVKYVPPSPEDGYIFNSNAAGYCSLGNVSYTNIKNGDKYWLRLSMNQSMLQQNNLPLEYGGSSGNTGCVSGSVSSVTLNPYTARHQVGSFYIDWWSNQKGTVYLYQEPDFGCNNSSCSVQISFWFNNSQFDIQTITFSKPVTSSYVGDSSIDDQCQSLRNSCTLINYQCSDNTAIKTLSGVDFNLSNLANKYGLPSTEVCWNGISNYYCGDNVDTCTKYRDNPNCTFEDNTCLDKDYISGICKQYQSKYTCASAYQEEQSTICTDVVCASNESGIASSCYHAPTAGSDASTLSSVIAYVQMGQNMAQDMNCGSGDPETCTLFAGKYETCYMYLNDPSKLDGYYNNGADCGIHREFFNGVATGYAASDKNLYSQATSGTNNIMGSSTNYSLSQDNTNAINNTVQLQQSLNNATTNQDENISYSANSSRNSSLAISDGQVASVTINKDAIAKVNSFFAFQNYLSDGSVNLAWDRQKAEPDPNNIKSITFSDLGITRRSQGKAFGWNTGTSQPVINGLCVHLADYCQGGNDKATSSDLVKSELSLFAAYANPNFCAACTSEIAGACMTGEPRNTLQQWCCFPSKVALDINLAAYDQNLINLYTDDGSRYSNQVNTNNGICGGVTVGMISRIDFSKGDYFKDLMSSIDVSQIVNTSNFTNANVSSNTQNRSVTDATSLVNEYKKSN